MTMQASATMGVAVIAVNPAATSIGFQASADTGRSCARGRYRGTYHDPPARPEPAERPCGRLVGRLTVCWGVLEFVVADR